MRAKTRGERREAKAKKKRQMGISGKSIFLLQYLLWKLPTKKIAPRISNTSSNRGILYQRSSTSMWG